MVGREGKLVSADPVANRLLRLPVSQHADMVVGTVFQNQAHLEGKGGGGEIKEKTKWGGGG